MKKSLLLQFPLLIAAACALAQSGALDLTFDPAAGADATVHAIAVQTDGKVLIGGDFTTYSGTSTGRIARLNADGSLDATFNTGSGFNNTVQAIALHSDGRIYAAGWFTTFNGNTANRIVRLNADGSLDASFTPGDGPNAAVLSMAVDADDRPVIGGIFANVAGTARASIARMSSDGTLDTSFDPGTGANAQVSAMAIQPDGNILIAGSFTTYNGSTRGRVARILSTGLIDATFNANPGVSNNSVSAIAVRPDGKVVIGGAFTFVFGTARNRIAALNADGTLDTGFNPGTGASAVVQSLTVDADNRTVMGGAFATVNGIARNRIARLNADGSMDTGFNPGTGAASNVLALARQTDGRILMTGAFTEYNGTTRNRVARLYGCTLAQPDNISGQVEGICIETGLIYDIPEVSGAETYSWTLPDGWTGDSDTEFITVTSGPQGGEISVIAESDACGVSPPQTLEVEVAPLAPEVPICLVTVDSTSQFNIIAWEKPVTALIDSFYVYREITTDNFQKIGSVAYDSLSLFNDFAANPNNTFHRYRLSVLDTCGYESEPGAYHSTIFLQVQANGNLNWTLYDIEGQPNPVNSFQVYRDNFGTDNFLPIGSPVPGGNGFFTDPDYASFPDARYVVDVNWDFGCTSTRENVNINTTRSNIELVIPADPVGLPSMAQNLSFGLFPNPASTSVTIVLPDNSPLTELVLRNMLGQDIHRSPVAAGRNELPLHGITAGVYMVQVGSGVRRLVVE